MNVVIIGNSAAGLSALQNFRKLDKTSRVVMISKEGLLPYSRVLLPYVLRGKLPYDGMTIRTQEFFSRMDAQCVEGTVTKLDTAARRVLLEDGRSFAYDKVLIATGSYAVTPPIEGAHQPGVVHMWTKADVDELLPLFQGGKRAVVIGSGFVSLQAAWAACYRGMKVTVIELMDRIMPSVLDEHGAEVLVKAIGDKGVTLHTGTSTEKIEKQADGSFLVYLKDKAPVAADFVIMGTGVRPNVAFLEGSGVTVTRGIPVDEYMRTNVPDVYAAGDVAAGPTAFGDEHMIHALWPTAVEMGKTAAFAMAGQPVAYEGSLNMNVTQMYDVTVASMGRFNDADIDETRCFAPEDGYGYLKVCYKDGYIVGACLVGESDAVTLFGKLRPIIRKKQKVDCDIHDLEQITNMRAFAKALSHTALRSKGERV